MKKEVYCGFEMKQFNHIRDVLDRYNIWHTYKIVDLSALSSIPIQNTVTRTVSRPNSDDSGAEKQYYIYVSKKDYEKAQILIMKG